MNALIICFAEDKRPAYVDLVRSAGIEDMTLSSGDNVRHLVTERTFDVIVTVLPFEREFGLDTAAFISGRTDAEQVIFVPSKVYDEVCSKAVGLPVSILPKNVPANIAVNTIRRALSVKCSLDKVKNENDDLRRRAEDEKLIYRAKCVLIEYLKLSEPDAHRLLQKRAMDRRTSLADAARSVLNTYEYREGLD
ncbi:MAG: ANTAR domain-containing protein [Oscillospiraceae bacterium]|jgi:response regulator NasT|nr:ANTAR domain-containing protein [Oscillospiraceae bacterium]